jgi:hypothetical protein
MHKSNHTNKLIIWQQYTTILLNEKSYITLKTCSHFNFIMLFVQSQNICYTPAGQVGIDFLVPIGG